MAIYHKKLSFDETTFLINEIKKSFISLHDRKSDLPKGTINDEIEVGLESLRKLCIFLAYRRIEICQEKYNENK